jgi:glycerol-3-phosphate responsive antiterminator
MYIFLVDRNALKKVAENIKNYEELAVEIDSM